MFRATTIILIGVTMTGCGHIAGGVDIWEAVEQNDAVAIRKFKAAGGDVNVLGWNGSTPLWTALEHKKRYSYEALLDCGADPNVIMRGKRVITHWAALEKDPWWLRLALEHGANPNLVNVGYGRPDEGPPLMFAISERGSLENVKLLVEHGSNINHPYLDRKYPCYPLADADLSTKFDIVLYLLEQGADYGLAECAGEAFLKHFEDQYKNRDKWYRLRDGRSKIDDIYSFLKARGVNFNMG